MPMKAINRPKCPRFDPLGAGSLVPGRVLFVALEFKQCYLVVFCDRLGPILHILVSATGVGIVPCMASESATRAM